MHARIAFLALLTALVASCKNVDCGEGTTERDGLCVPSNETIGTAQCGPFTVLQGDRCVPMFPPTQCDPDTTAPDTDSTGVTTCIGTGAGGCSARIACPTPAMGTQTICGQIYDFENNQPFAEPDATGDQCMPGATSGPCSLGIRAYDGALFAMNPMTAPLTTGPVYIDDCGRYIVPDIPQPAGPAVALAIDDAMSGPPGTTNAVGVATAKMSNGVTRDLEAFIVRMSTVSGWTGGPSLAAGIYAPVYRARSTGTEPAIGVTFTYAPMSNPTNFMSDMNRDHYFLSGSTNRSTLDGNANATTTNGTALVSGANLTEFYAGQGGGLPSQCRFEPHVAAAIPFAIFVQIFRPISVPGMTCPL